MAGEEATIGEDLKRFLNDVLKKSENLNLHPTTSDVSDLLHIDLLEKSVELLRICRALNVHSIPSESTFQSLIELNDEKTFFDLETVFTDIHRLFSLRYINESAKSTNCIISGATVVSSTPGRPRFDIPLETLEELRSLHFTWNQIAKMFGVSRWTILRRVKEFGLEHLQRFTVISNAEIDNLVKDFISKHGNATGEPFLSGYLRSLGHHIPRRRIRESINRVDPVNTILRWGALVSRRSYC